jgi:branched-chain amino acid transport system substrate-binding protein
MMPVARAIASCLAAVAACIALSSCGSDVAVAPDPACDADPANCVIVGIGEPIYLGSLLFMGDPVGADTRNTIALALDYLDGAFDGRNGKVLGHPVDVVAETENCTARGGRQGARRLLLDADIVAVIGPTCSAAAYRAASTVLSPRKILMISPTATSPLLTQPEGRERYFFRTAFNDLIQAAVLADFTTSRLGASTAATLATDDPYSAVLADSYAGALRSGGGSVVRRENVSSRGGIPAAASRIAAARPAAIFLPLFEPTCSQVVRSLRAQPALARTPVVVSESCMVPAFFRGVGAGTPELFGAVPAVSRTGRDDFYRSAFLPAYRERFGVSPASAFAPQAFDATSLVVAAIRRVAVPLPGGALRINRADLRVAMLEVEGYEGLSGTLRCLASGDCVPNARISVYRGPAWPTGAGGAQPVFSGSRALADVTGSG